MYMTCYNINCNTSIWARPPPSEWALAGRQTSMRYAQSTFVRYKYRSNV